MREPFLSEPHNFGQRVRLLEDGFLSKPRTLFWENLLLGNSRLRSFLDTSVFPDDKPSFTLPTLQFRNLYQFSGEVSVLNLTPISSFTADEANRVGRTLGLFAWFGISDLHRENIQFGRNETNDVVFTSVDIETVFDDLRTLGHSGLVPDRYLPSRYAGASSLASLLREHDNPDLIASVCNGYLEALFALENCRKQIEDILKSAITDTEPIRVVLRKTLSYTRCLQGANKPGDFEVPVFPSEREQLQRGDVPYFFRFGSSPDTIRCFVSKNDIGVAELGADFASLSLLKRRSVSKLSFEQPQGVLTLTEIGVLQLASYLVASIRQVPFNANYLGCRIQRDDKQLFLTYGASVRLSCKLRDIT